MWGVPHDASTDPLSTSAPRVAVVVVAAGSGTRLGVGFPKALVPLGDGRSMLRHALDGVLRSGVDSVVVVAPEGRIADASADALAADPTGGVRVVPGGATRQSSVAAGLAAIDPGADAVLVHDAARALTPPAAFARVVAALADGWAGAIPVLPVIDTIKRVEAGEIVGVVDRSELSAAQTPQGFRRDVLEAAYRDAAADFTDDAALVAASGHRVAAVAGDALAFKITTSADLDRARALTGGPVLPRVGIGTDVHAFGGDGALWLAGLEWPGEPALSGHSDGDAVAHAIVDAVLAAAGIGDIGTHFGVDRPEFAGAHAAAFLARTAELAAAAGWRVGNVSVQVQTRRPRFAARRAEAEAALSAALGAPVSVSATTTDGLGFTGVGDGVAAYAVALVVPA